MLETFAQRTQKEILFFAFYKLRYKIEQTDQCQYLTFDIRSNAFESNQNQLITENFP